MSAAYEIAYGGRAPADPGENSKFHQQLIDDMTAEAARCGWEGSAFSAYQRRDGYVSLSIVPGASRPTLEDLRNFREEQRLADEAEAREQPEQGRLC